MRGADISEDPFVSYDEKEAYASTVDLALYASYQAYQRIAAKYPHTYAVMSGVQSEMALYPFGPLPVWPLLHALFVRRGTGQL